MFGLVSNDPQTDRAGVVVLEELDCLIASGSKLIRDGLADSTVTSGDAISVTGGDTLFTKVLGDARLVVEGGLLISSLLKLLELNTTVARLGDERGLELGLGGESEDELALLALVALRNIEIENSAVAIADVGVVLSTVGGVRVVAINGDDQARLQVRVHVGEVARAVSGAGRSSGRLLDGRNLGLSHGRKSLSLSFLLRNWGKSLSLNFLLSADSSCGDFFSLQDGGGLLLGLVDSGRDSLGLVDSAVLSLVNGGRNRLHRSFSLVSGVGVLLSLDLNLVLSHGNSDIVLLGDCLYDGRGLTLLSRD